MKFIIPGILAVACAVWLSACSSSSSSPSGAGERDPASSSARGQDPGTTRVADPGDAIDQDLMIALGQAKNFHHKAKIYMTDGNLTAATAAVRQILSLAFPKGAAEADDVRNDARALLAKLLVSQGQIDEATRAIDEGLAQSQRESFFVANLYTVQGEIHEARAATFDAMGEAGKASATDERRAAIGSYDRSIQINERLQKKLMEER
jgi:tetratricopeptide (TPR) repeat protein